MIEVMIIIAVIAVLSTIMIPNLVRGRDASKLSACKQNLRSMAGAMESYAADNGGRYPTDLRILPVANGGYIRELPQCPCTGTDTPYISGYQVHADPNGYTIQCQGDNHVGTGIQTDFPQYSGAGGMRDKPD